MGLKTQPSRLKHAGLSRRDSAGNRGHVSIVIHPPQRLLLRHSRRILLDPQAMLARKRPKSPIKNLVQCTNFLLKFMVRCNISRP